jgi:hypothetical protein
MRRRSGLRRETVQALMCSYGLFVICTFERSSALVPMLDGMAT